MKYLSEVPMLQEIDAMMERLTDAAIERAGDKLPVLDDNDEALGVIMNPLTRRLLAASYRYRTEETRLMAEAGAALNDADEYDLEIQSERSRLMAEVAVELAWTLIKTDLKLFARDGGLRIGQKWMVAGFVRQAAEIDKVLLMRLIKQQEDDD